MHRKTGLILAALALAACAGPPPMPPPSATMTLGDAMRQAVDALAATRAQAAGQGVRACGAEVVLQVMPAAGPHGVQLVLAPPDHEEGNSSAVTLTLAGENCDAAEPQPRARR